MTESELRQYPFCLRQIPPPDELSRFGNDFWVLDYCRLRLDGVYQLGRSSSKSYHVFSYEYSSFHRDQQNAHSRNSRTRHERKGHR